MLWAKNTFNKHRRAAQRNWISNLQETLYILRFMRLVQFQSSDRVKYRFGNLAKRVIHKIRNRIRTRYIARENNYSKQSNDRARWFMRYINFATKLPCAKSSTLGAKFFPLIFRSSKNIKWQVLLQNEMLIMISSCCVGKPTSTAKIVAQHVICCQIK